MTQSNDPLLVTIAEAATLLRCGPKAIRKSIAAGELPVVRLGERTQRIPVAALREFVERRSEGQAPRRPVVLKPVRQYRRVGQ